MAEPTGCIHCTQENSCALHCLSTNNTHSIMFFPFFFSHQSNFFHYYFSCRFLERVTRWVTGRLLFSDRCLFLVDCDDVACGFLPLKWWTAYPLHWTDSFLFFWSLVFFFHVDEICSFALCRVASLRPLNHAAAITWYIFGRTPSW